MAPNGHDEDMDIDLAGLADFIIGEKQVPVDMSKLWNANVDDIFRNKYLSPRPPSRHRAVVPATAHGTY